MQDGSQLGVYGQRYSVAGTRDGSEFRVNTFRANNQFEPSVAGLSGGGFVVTWTSEPLVGFPPDVYGQLYSATGARVGSQFRINTFKTNFQWRPSVVGLGNGGFVVTWTSYFDQDGSGGGVYGQRYSATGVRVGGEFRVNTYTTNNQDRPSVAGLGNGGFVVTWNSYGQDGSNGGVYGQRFSAAGVRVGAEFRVNTYTTNYQYSPSVAGFGNGGFVVTWTSSGNQDGSFDGIYGQRFSAAGALAGVEFRVNSYTTNNQLESSVAGLGNGGFVVAWHSYGQDGSEDGVYGQRFSP